MHNLQKPYTIRSDRFSWRMYWVAFVVLLTLMMLGGHVEGPDDTMRWVSVVDLQSGQGWFDPYQHRLGPGNGTLMHWSRLVDAPIAAIYWLSALILPPELALNLTAFLWPSLLAGLTLWVFAVTGGALGGRAGAVSALAMGALAILNSGKFDHFSFDHHGLQVLLFLTAVMLFILRKQKSYAGWALGACLALSVSIGAEALAQIALIGLFVAADWIIVGEPSRRRTMTFSAAILLTLLLTALSTASRESFLFPGCDAFTLSVVLPASLSAVGLLGSAYLLSNSVVWARILCFLAVGTVVVFVAYVYAPHCLANPIDEMSTDVQEYWLSQITEAQNVTLVIQRHAGETLALLGIAVFSIFAAVVFIRASEFKIEYLLLLCLMTVSFLLFLYQSRMMTFLTMSLVAVQAQVLRVLYQMYKIEGQKLFGVLMIVFVAFMSPKTGGRIENWYSALAAREDQSARDEPGEILGVVSCNAEHSFKKIRDLPPGLVIVGFDYASYILRYTPHSVLAGNYHRNEAGLLAQIDLFRSEVSAIEARLAELGVDYLLICKFHPRTNYWSSVSEGAGLTAGLLSGELPAFLEEIDGGSDAAFHIFRVRNG